MRPPASILVMVVSAAYVALLLGNILLIFTTNTVNLTCFPTNGAFSFSWSTIPGRIYHVQWKEQFGDPTWNALTNITASGISASFSEVPQQTQRFFQVAQ